MQGRDNIFRPKLGSGAENHPEIGKKLRADTLIKDIIRTGENHGGFPGSLRPIARDEIRDCQ